MEQADAVFRALADPARRRIIDELALRDGQSLFEICGRLAQRHKLGISRQAISKHLAVLEEAGIVVTEWQGRTKLHRLDLSTIAAVSRGWLGRYSKGEVR